MIAGSIVQLNASPQDPVPHLDFQAAAAYLRAEKTYMVKEVQAGKYETYVYLNEFPGHPFNLKMFKVSNLEHKVEDIAVLHTSIDDGSPKTAVADHESKLEEEHADTIEAAAKKIDPDGAIKVKVAEALAAALGFSIKHALTPSLLSKKKRSWVLASTRVDSSKLSNRVATDEEVQMWFMLVELRYIDVMLRLK